MPIPKFNLGSNSQEKKMPPIEENQNVVEEAIENNTIKETQTQDEISQAEAEEIKDKIDSGQIKCPKCGSTDISINTKTGKLRCHFCRYEFEEEKAEEDADIETLEGTTISKGMSNIQESTDDVITLKCPTCGAEVIVDTNHSTQARCHWCRSMLSITSQIPNGAVPDKLLPFKVSKEEAEKQIAEFVNKRKFFASSKFRREFKTDNILGVYFPYTLVDVNAHSYLDGEGEIQTRHYTVGSGDDKEDRYDANVYSVKRDFDITIDDMCLETSGDKLNYSDQDKTTNIINAILPFDSENCVKYNPNYLQGFTSEKRDCDVDKLKDIAETRTKDIARHAAKDTIEEYDRGVKWEDEETTIKGDSWKACYFPVWLYSYMETKKDKNLLHYVAVNGRTKKTMGSVPLNMLKLIICTVLYGIAGLSSLELIKFLIKKCGGDANFNASIIFVLPTISFFFIMYVRYRNINARFKYEKQTKVKVTNVKKKDTFKGERKGLEGSNIEGRNDNKVDGDLTNNFLSKGIFGSLRVNDDLTLGEAILENSKTLEEKDKQR